MDGIHIYWQCSSLVISKKIKKTKKKESKIKSNHYIECIEDRRGRLVTYGQILILNHLKMYKYSYNIQTLITPELTELLEKVFTNIDQRKRKQEVKKEDEKKEITLIDPKRI